MADKRKKGSSHEETDLVISWDTITPSDMKKLAQIAIVHNWQSMAIRSKTKLPEKVSINAADCIHEPAYCLIPFAPKAKVANPVDKQLEKLLSGLSPEQLAAFLK
ncbi:MAG: hypothetical protein DDT31_01673 [Syntrophomonadaceae bacterium]|nr:hypothetical protein [Bacillota bacterium]